MTAKKRFLVVDDEENNRNAIAHFLRKFNYDVTTASNGNEALDSFKKDYHHLIITNLIMPGPSGIDLLKRVKTIAPQTEIIIMTAYAEVESYLEAMNLGAFEYLNKPIKVDELKKIITEVFSHHKDDKPAI